MSSRNICRQQVRQTRHVTHAHTRQYVNSLAKCSISSGVFGNSTSLTAARLHQYHYYIIEYLLEMFVIGKIIFKSYMLRDNILLLLLLYGGGGTRFPRAQVTHIHLDRLPTRPERPRAVSAPPPPPSFSHD